MNFFLRKSIIIDDEVIVVFCLLIKGFIIVNRSLVLKESLICIKVIVIFSGNIY